MNGVGSYVAWRNPDNTVNVHFDDADAYHIMTYMKPINRWRFTIKPGDTSFNIPGATEDDVEDIGLAYFKDIWNLHKPPKEGKPIYHDPHPESSNIIDAPVFDPNYKKPPMELPAGGTIVLKPKG